MTTDQTRLRLWIYPALALAALLLAGYVLYDLHEQDRVATSMRLNALELKVKALEIGKDAK